MNGTVKVLLADDSEAVCKAIQTLLSEEPSIEVVDESRTFSQTLEVATVLHPDVILLDLHMPRGDPDFDHLTAKLRLRSCCDRVVAMSIANDEETKTLATLYGATVLLDKANLAVELIPALLPSSNCASV